jgi:hypothetical protein
MTSVTDGDESLTEARNSLNNASGVKKDVDDALRRTDKALRDLTDVRRKLDTARWVLRKARWDRDMTKETNKALWGRSMDDLDDSVVRLLLDNSKLKAAANHDAPSGSDASCAVPSNP